MRRLAAFCALLLASPAGAETAFDLIFRQGTLDGMPEGAALLYDATGAGPGGADRSGLAVTLEGGGEAVVSTGDPARPLGRFPASVGNPVAMVLLEDTVLAIAEETGGSPFYIRNRFRDALGAEAEGEPVTLDWDGSRVAGTAVTLAPFRDDPHRAQLGRFADLTVRVVVSEAVPGWYHSIAAESGGTLGYSASATLRGAAP